MSVAHKKDYSCQGWLFKWTNYWKGYQKRWFVLENGLLSYYRNQSEIAHTCRGTINLRHARIDTLDNLSFTVSNSSVQTYHLRACTEFEKDMWINKFKKVQEDQSQQSENFQDGTTTEVFSLNCIVQEDACLVDLRTRIIDLENYEHHVCKEGEELLRSLSNLEDVLSIEEFVKLNEKQIFLSKKSTSFKVKVNTLILALKKFIEQAKVSHDQWTNQLSREREQRCRLERMIEELAKQHSNLERQIKNQNELRVASSPSNNIGSKLNKTPTNIIDETTISAAISVSKTDTVTVTSDDEDAFFDASDMGFTVNEELDDSFCVTLPNNYNGPRQNMPLDLNNDTDSFSAYSSSSDEEKLKETNNIPMDHNVGNVDADDNNARQIVRVITRKQKHFRKRRATVEDVEGKNSATKEQRRAIKPSEDVDSIVSCALKIRTRRTFIPPRPNYSVNLWSIMKNCIGKELTKIPVPVNFNEPLSMLQRLTEDYEYSSCLDAAAKCNNSIQQLAYVAAFSVSAYSTTLTRTGKPFNPLLGETYECDRRDDMGWRSIAEQVSHHPPMAAIHCESSAWNSWQEFTLTSKFRGKYLSVVPLGTAHLKFKNSENHYSWRKVTSTVHNIIVGRLWIDNHGEMDIYNHHTGETCHLSYKAYSYFSRDAPRRVMGVIYNKDKQPTYLLRGTWDLHMEGAFITKIHDNNWETGPWELLWQKTPNPPNSDKMYNFTTLAIQLNEMEDDVAPTDCRRRPDQRLMEDGKWDEANKEKERLEEKQRFKRRQKEIEKCDEDSSQSSLSVKGSGDNEGPVWFVKKVLPETGESAHVYNGEYWESKANQDWSKCPDIY